MTLRYTFLVLLLATPFLAVACVEDECETSQDCPELECDGTTLQIFTITTKQVGIITFKTFMGTIATQSTTTARNGELFLVHFE